MKVKVKVAQSCSTLCDPMDYTTHGILQARILEWVAFPFFRGSWTRFPHCRQILHQLSHKGSPRISLIESNNFFSPRSPFTLLSWIDHVSSAPTMVFWTTCTLHLLTDSEKKIYDPFLPICQHSYSIFSSVLLNYACSDEKHLSSINVFKMWGLFHTPVYPCRYFSVHF